MIFVILFTVLCVLFAYRIRFENSIESFISRNDPDLKYYQAFKKQFHDDQMIILVIPVGDVFTKENLVKIDQVSQAIKNIPEVRKVRSITTIQDIVGTEGGFQVQRFIDKIPDDPEKLRSLRKSALSNPLYQRDLMSPDGKIASFLIEAKSSDDEARYKKIFYSLRSILRNSPFKDQKYYIAGEPLVEFQLTQDMWKDLGLFVPLTYISLFILLLILFSELTIVLIILLVITFSLAFLIGLMGVLGTTMNVVTAGLPSIILCIAVLDIFHISNSYRVNLSRGREPVEAMHATLVEYLEPCFLTTFTTVIGFISMCTTRLVPVQRFGILGAGATAAAYILWTLLMPFLLIKFIPVAQTVDIVQKKRAKLKAFFAFLYRFYDRKIIMIPAIVLIILISLLGLSRVKVETDNLLFLKKNTLVRRSTDFVETNLGGTSSLEITVRAPREDMMMEPRILKQIESFQKNLSSLPEVDKTVSPVQYLKQMHQVMNEGDSQYYFIPESRKLIAQYLLTYSFSGRNNDLDDFFDNDYRTARVRGRMKHQTSLGLRKTLRKFDHFAASLFEKGLDVRITSHSLLQTNMVDTLIKGQISGLGVSFLFLVLTFAVAYRSWSVGLFSMIPNIIPLLACFGLMGFLNITLNIGTAMIVCLCFGLVVDDTLHILHQVRRGFAREEDVASVLEKIFDDAGFSIMFSSLLLTAGFAILMLGQSQATIWFGGMCAFTIFFGLVCDLMITPFIVMQIPAVWGALKRQALAQKNLHP